MSRLCLDTSAYSHFRRGRTQVVELVDQAAWIGVPTVVLGEHRARFARGAKQADNQRHLRQFLDHPVVHVLDVDEATASHYAGIVNAVRSAGTPLPTNDIWIAAVAARHGAAVVTHDHHFSSIHRVAALILH